MTIYQKASIGLTEPMLHACALARYLDASSPGKHRTSQSTLPDQYAEDLSFPKIYLGESRRINPDVHASVVDRATGETRRRDKRSLMPPHVLFMVMKLLRFLICSGSSVTFLNMVSLTNVTKKMLRDDSFVEECVEHDFAFIRKIPNSVVADKTRRLHCDSPTREADALPHADYVGAAQRAFAVPHRAFEASGPRPLP
ncbi:hypothetical protein HPB49_023333 [Dermacentor silvarum]|uniref:Uncharacterized protein n=1 Tax=Dermacentor silvarum TaxID=543639 RepID=A0ACB8D8X0_DERSI|nr:hypothetical protein HPB49_023333 [Dermacentor silvarum]